MSDHARFRAVRAVYAAAQYIAAGAVVELPVAIGDANRHLERVDPLPAVASATRSAPPQKKRKE